MGVAGPLGPAGPVGAKGRDGRDARCTVKRGKKTPKVSCRLVATKSTQRASARLTRNGKTYARGTVTTLVGNRRLPAGSYTLRYREAGTARAVAVRLR